MMLTRAEAKTKECPFRMAGFLANSSLKFNDISWMGKEIKCYAEGCPKWKDQIDGSTCLGEREYIETHYSMMDDAAEEACRSRHGISLCRDCPDMFGYCGG